MSITVILIQLLQLFMMICLGFFIGKCHLFHYQFSNDLTKFVLNITMPFLILSSVTTSHFDQMPIIDILYASFLLVFLLPIIAYVIIKVLHIQKNASLYMFMISYPNVGFMGFPLIQSIYGQGALLYTAMINIGFNISLFSIGILMMNYQNQHEFHFSFRKLMTPGIISSLLAFIIYIFSVPIPTPIADFCTSIGNMTTPLSMFIIGLTMSQYDIKQMLCQGRIYLFCIFINFILPIGFMPLFQLIQNDIVKGIALIILAMPVANSAALYAKTYHQNEQLAVQTIFISTLLSVITIPLLVYFFLI